MKGYQIKWAALLCALGFLLTGCENDIDVTNKTDAISETQEALEEPLADGPQVFAPQEYDSKDTAVVVRVDEAEKTITLLNRIVQKNYTLSYDGTTKLMDKYGEAVSAAQLLPGDIVEVCFQHIPKKCVSLMLSPAAWQADVKEGFVLNQARKQISFNGELYTLAERMVLRSGDEEIELEDLNERDVLSVQGLENTIYSICVEKGHGYLRLSGAEYFTDGFIEIGQVMAQRITEDMLLTVPEGEYTVVVRNNGHSGSKEAKIYRDEETTLDLSDLKGEEIRTGNVFFTLTPADASVYIDGEKIDTSTYVTLEYGVHQMIVKADGYETISQYLKVGKENANLNVEMEPDGSGEKKEDEKTAGEKSQEETGGEVTDTQQPQVQPPSDTTTVTADGTWRVKVNAPASAEVYVDGNYVGLAPVSFPKKAGSHVISLRRSGYQTRSYTIQVDEEEKDMELSFSELVKKESTDLNTIGTGDAEAWANSILSKTLLGS